jgi:hypothetical protein
VYPLNADCVGVSNALLRRQLEGRNTAELQRLSKASADMKEQLDEAAKLARRTEEQLRKVAEANAESMRKLTTELVALQKASK